MISLTEYVLESEKDKTNGFAILKPGFTDKKEDFEKALERESWKITDSKQMKMTFDDAKNLYKCHEKEDFYDDLCKYMSSDKCICYTLYKDCDNPIEDLKSLKEEMRKKYGKDEMRNCMHSSDSKENVRRESKICFCSKDGK